MTDNTRIWGPRPPQSNPTPHAPGAAAGDDKLSSAVGQLHWEHPHHVQAEGLQNMGNKAIHRPVTSSTYRGKPGGG